MSNRGQQWQEFNINVFRHIEEYTVLQYGDYPKDQVTSWSVEECMNQIKKYANRAGRQARSGQELLDLLKIAHYAQLAYHKLKSGCMLKRGDD